MRDRHIESLSGLSFQLAIHYPLSSTPRLVHILPLHLQDIFPPTLLEEGPHTTILLMSTNSISWRDDFLNTDDPSRDTNFASFSCPNLGHTHNSPLACDYTVVLLLSLQHATLRTPSPYPLSPLRQRPHWTNENLQPLATAFTD